VFVVLKSDRSPDRRRSRVPGCGEPPTRGPLPSMTGPTSTIATEAKAGPARLGLGRAGRQIICPVGGRADRPVCFVRSDHDGSRSSMVLLVPSSDIGRDRCFRWCASDLSNRCLSKMPRTAVTNSVCVPEMARPGWHRIYAGIAALGSSCGSRRPALAVLHPVKSRLHFGGAHVVRLWGRGALSEPRSDGLDG
jgi:hypothetical protein